MKTRMKLAALGLAALLVPSLAYAEQAETPPEGEGALERPAPTDEERARAAEHYQRGLEFYRFGNHDDAVREYLAGYELTGASAFLFNIGQTYRAKGDKQQALAYYERYLEVDPDGDGALSARSHVELLKAEIEAEREAEERRQREAEEAEARRRAEAEEARRAAEEARLRVDAAEARRRENTALWLRRSGLGGGAAGVVTLGVSMYFGQNARSLSREVSRTAATDGAWSTDLDDKSDRAHSSQRTMWILGASGTALAAAGAVLYVSGAQMRAGDSPVEAQPVAGLQIGPALVPGGAGVSLGGSF
jgi:tetratricopeptide (TPR) repeat protein